MFKDKELNALHSYYLSILSCMPNIVYWLDKECNMVGCNQNAYDWLGITRCSDFANAPYNQLVNRTGWSEARAKTLRLDDMAALFSAKATKNIVEPLVVDDEGYGKQYLSTRVPLFDDDKKVIGLVVCLVEQSVSLQNLPVPTTCNIPTFSPSVLLIEGNALAQTLQSSVLTQLHCEVDVASSGVEALALFEPGKYDLIFLELVLSDISGYMVAKKIRAEEAKTPYHVPMIALTSYDTDIVAPDCNYYSMAEIIQKPLSLIKASVIISRYCCSTAFTMDSVMALASPNSM